MVRLERRRCKATFDIATRRDQRNDSTCTTLCLSGSQMALCKQLGTMRVTICAAVVWLSLLSLTDMAAAAAGRRTDFEAYLVTYLAF